MAKKSKAQRANIPAQTLERARKELYGGTTIVESPAVKDTSPQAKPKAPVRRTRAVTIDDLKEEYFYVITDLRSMFILAVILFVGLIAVSLAIV